MLSEAKHLSPPKEILRFAQNDNVGSRIHLTTTQ